MNYFENNKRYLDHNGLKALILKIKELYTLIQDNKGDIDQLTTKLADLDERVDAIEANLGAELPELHALIDAIRAELGETPAEGTATVYERLAAAEAAIEALEGKVEDLENNAFQSVNSTYDVSSKKVTLSFANGEGSEVGTAVIDTTDFVIDGMIEDVYMATLGKDGKFYISVNHPGADPGVSTEVLETELSNELGYDFLRDHGGHKFIIMRFKTSSGGEKGVKDVLLEAEQLFQDYNFSAEGVDGYLNLSASNTPSTETTGAQAVKYSVSLGDKLVDDLKLINGELAKDSANASAGNYRGVKELDEKLATAEGKIESLEAQASADEERIAKLEKSVDGEEEDGSDGLIKRTEALETWIDDQSIPVEQLNAVFDKIVYGTDMPETSYDWFDPATDLGD